MSFWALLPWCSLYLIVANKHSFKYSWCRFVFEKHIIFWDFPPTMEELKCILLAYYYKTTVILFPTPKVCCRCKNGQTRKHWVCLVCSMQYRLGGYFASYTVIQAAVVYLVSVFRTDRLYVSYMLRWISVCTSYIVSRLFCRICLNIWCLIAELLIFIIHFNLYNANNCDGGKIRISRGKIL